MRKAAIVFQKYVRRWLAKRKAKKRQQAVATIRRYISYSFFYQVKHIMHNIYFMFYFYILCIGVYTYFKKFLYFLNSYVYIFCYIAKLMQIYQRLHHTRWTAYRD